MAHLKGRMARKTHSLTEKQRKFFGARASGYPAKRTKASSIRKTKR